MTRIYLDHNATSPLSESVRAAMVDALGGHANAGSVHHEGQQARASLERCRRIVRSAIGPGRIVFTSGATEANNIIIAPLGRGDVVLTSRLEHPSVREPIEAAASRGADVRWIPNDQAGSLDLEFISRSLSDGDVTFAAVMAANNETGTINPIAEIGRLCAEARVPLHVDAVQAFGRTSWRPTGGVSSATASAHKLAGPAGIGALWLRDASRVVPLCHGGHQERGLRPGTENVWGALGFAAAVECVSDWSASAPARDAFEALLVEECGAAVNGRGTTRLPNTANLSFVGLDSEELLMALDLAGVACSAGSACTAGSIDVSPVIEALGVGEARIRSALRFSFGPADDKAHGIHAAERVRDVVDRLRR